MKPDDSAAAFQLFVASNGIVLRDCAVREGVDQMVSFYASVPSKGCDVDDGDMLLFQWGTHDWGSGKHFGLDITRQFIERTLEDDDAISQLSLTFEFDRTPERELLGHGNRWCHERAELEGFREFAINSAAFSAVADRKPLSVELRYSRV